MPPTPLPALQLSVLSISIFGELLSASLAAPFLYSMLDSFDLGETHNREAKIGYYCGVIGSAFFLAQFLTGVLWVSAAERYGRRAVLVVSLLGNGLSLMAFGTSGSVRMAVCIRLVQGFFNGAVGVARGAVSDISDQSNEGRVISILSLCFGMGGLVGSIIGGLTHTPVVNLPWLFGNSKLFAAYPYLFPCLIGGSITLSGSILSLSFQEPRLGVDPTTKFGPDLERRPLLASVRKVPGRMRSETLDDIPVMRWPRGRSRLGTIPCPASFCGQDLLSRKKGLRQSMHNLILSNRSDVLSLADLWILDARSQPDSAVDSCVFLPSAPSTRAPSLIGAGDKDEDESVWGQLPLKLIAVYACVVLHGTTCESIFMPYLISPIDAGGLGLTSQHYSELIAAMFFVALISQFLLYPSLAPPNGPFSHLSILKLGCTIYIPAYLIFPLLVSVPSPFLMPTMLLLSTFRNIANTLSYTSLMILINRTTPLPLVPLSNGIAQSLTSLVRAIGPVLGGTMWAISMERGWNGMGFGVVSIFAVVGLGGAWSVVV